MVKEILNEYEIEKILDIFTPYLYTLRNNIVDKRVYAKKIKKHGHVIVLYMNSVVVGFAAFYCNNVETREAFLSYIAVKNDFSGRGFGKKLFNEVKKISKKNNMIAINLEVRKENRNAIIFYEKLGFCPFPSEKKETVYYALKL